MPILSLSPVARVADRLYGLFECPGFAHDGKLEELLTINFETLFLQNESSCNFFAQWCHDSLEDEDLYRACEASHCVTRPGEYEFVMPFARSMFVGWLKAANSVRHRQSVNEAVPSPSWSPQLENTEVIQDVLIAAQAWKLLRGFSLEIPASYISHPHIPVAYFAGVVAASSIVIARNSVEFESFRKIVVHGTEDSNGEKFPMIVDLIDEYLRLKCTKGVDAETLRIIEQQLWKCRLRFFLLATFATQFGQLETVAAVEENPEFFSQNLQTFLCRVPEFVEHDDPLIHGFINDLFCVFELGFLDMSLLPTPELLRATWSVLQRLLGPASWASNEPTGHEAKRSRFFRLFISFRSLQFDGGHLTRHEQTAIIKEKLRILGSCNLEDPLGRFGFTVSTNLSFALDNDAYETMVRAMYRGTKLLIAEVAKNKDDSDVSSSRKLRVLWERYNVLANLLDFIFRQGGFHASVLPLVMLSYRSPEDEAANGPDFLMLMLQLLSLAPLEAVAIVNLLSVACMSNPRDCAHRFIDRQVLQRIFATYKSTKEALGGLHPPGSPAKTIAGLQIAAQPPLLKKPCSQIQRNRKHVEGFCELIISLILDAYCLNQHTQLVVQQEATTVSELIVDLVTTNPSAWYRLSRRLGEDAAGISIAINLVGRFLRGELPIRFAGAVVTLCNTAKQQSLIGSVRDHVFAMITRELVMECATQEISTQFNMEFTEDLVWLAAGMPKLAQWLRAARESCSDEMSMTSMFSIALLSFRLLRAIRRNYAFINSTLDPMQLDTQVKELVAEVNTVLDPNSQCDLVTPNMRLWVQHVVAKSILQDATMHFDPSAGWKSDQLPCAKQHLATYLLTLDTSDVVATLRHLTIEVIGSATVLSTILETLTAPYHTSPNLEKWRQSADVNSLMMPVVGNGIGSSLRIRAAIKSRLEDMQKKPLVEEGTTKKKLKRQRSERESELTQTQSDDVRRMECGVDTYNTLALRFLQAANTFYQVVNLCRTTFFPSTESGICSDDPGGLYSASMHFAEEDSRLILAQCEKTFLADTSNDRFHSVLNHILVVEFCIQCAIELQDPCSEDLARRLVSRLWEAANTSGIISGSTEPSDLLGTSNPRFWRLWLIFVVVRCTHRLVLREVENIDPTADDNCRKRARIDDHVDTTRSQPDARLLFQFLPVIRSLFEPSSVLTGEPDCDQESSIAVKIKRYLGLIFKNLAGARLNSSHSNPSHGVDISNAEWKLLFDTANALPLDVVPFNELLFDNPVVTYVFYRRVLERSFVRCHEAQHPAPDFVTIPLEKIGSEVKGSLFSFVVEENVLFAELKRCIKIDMIDEKHKPLLQWAISQDVVVVTIAHPVSGITRRYNALLQEPWYERRNPSLAAEVLAPLRDALRRSMAFGMVLHPADSSVLSLLLPAGVSEASFRCSSSNSTFGTLRDLASELRVNHNKQFIMTDPRADTEDSILAQRGLLVCTEEIVVWMLEELEALIASESDKFKESLDNFNTIFRVFVKSTNCSYFSAHLCRVNADRVFRCLLEDISSHAQKYVVNPSAASLLVYCVSIWMSGPFLPKHLKHAFTLDHLGNSIDVDEDDDDDEDLESDSDVMGDEEVVDEPSTTASQFQNEEPTASAASHGGNFQDFTCNCTTVNLTGRNSLLQPAFGDAYPADQTPVHYYPPPTNQSELNRLYFRLYHLADNPSLRVVVYCLSALFNTTCETLNKDVFSSIGVFASMTQSLRADAAEGILERIRERRQNQPSALPTLFNAYFTIILPAVSGIYRENPSEVVIETMAAREFRAAALDNFFREMVNNPSYFKVKIASVMMRLVALFHGEPADEPNCAHGVTEFVTDQITVPLHEHPLCYVSAGEGSAQCSFCRNENFFYHYWCTTCESVSCCVECKILFTNCETSRQRRTQQKIDNLEATKFALEGASLDQLKSIATSVLHLSLHPAFPAERVDGSVVVIDAVLQTALAKSSEGCAEIVLFLWEVVRSATENIIKRREQALRSAMMRFESLVDGINGSDTSDIPVLNVLREVDFMRDEPQHGALGHEFLPVMVIFAERLAIHPVLEAVVPLVQDYTQSVVCTFVLLAPIVSKLSNREAVFSSSPVNALYIAALAKTLGAMNSDRAASIIVKTPPWCPVTHEAVPLRRDNSAITLQRSETRAMLAETADTSELFSQVAPQLSSLSSDAKPTSLSQLSAIAVKNRALLNFIIRNCENPSQCLDAGVGVLIDPSQLDFAVRQKLFRSRIEEHLIDDIAEPLTIEIARDNILVSSLTALRAIRAALKQRSPRQIHVAFEGEEGVDVGGVTREWLTFFFKAVCDDGHILRQCGESQGCYELNPGKLPFNIPHPFEMLGIVVGMALMQNIPIEPHFTRALYKHMTGKQPSFVDLEATDGALFRNLMLVNQMSTPEEFDALCQSFTYCGESDEGETIEVELKPGGASIQVTQENKKEYIRLVANYVMTERVSKRIKAFLIGISRWFPLRWLTCFTAEEMELISCGLGEIDIEDWRAHTRYQGYTPSSPQIRWFWDLVTVCCATDRARLLQFARGSSKVPAAGFSSLKPPFTITASHDVERLPSSHTCHNQLDLPCYESPEQLRDKLFVALDFGGSGFGFA